jgi:predicted Ser/Thr protein kinase
VTTVPPLPAGLVNALGRGYELLREIGRGGMGVVYAARDTRLDRLVAIKVLPELVSSDVVRERFLREARAAARLSHPSIVPIYAADERDGVTFLVMAYVDGSTLAARLRAEGRLSPADAVPILRDVARALGAAQARGVIHRDIKPENILIDRATGRAMVTDFGIARLADALQSGALTRTGQVLGTVGYMSPEQVTADVVDGRSDLYSLGIVAFEMLAGRLPFEGPAPAVIVAHATKPAPPLASVAQDVPAALCAIVDRCLSKNPSDRLATGEALATALEQALDRAVAKEPALANAERERRALTEREAERVWQRAAELQAGIGTASIPLPAATLRAMPGTLGDGFPLEHVRQAAVEAGISAAYVSLALDEVLAPPDRRASSPAQGAERSLQASSPTVRSMSPRASRVPGAPMTLIYEVALAGQLSANDFDDLAHTIRSAFGDAGIATALGRSLSWSSSSGQGNQRRVHVSIRAVGQGTQVRIEEHLGPLAGGIFGGVLGGVGGSVGGSSLAVTLGALHSPLAALLVSGGVVVSAFALARTLFAQTVRRRDAQLRDLAGTLATQIAELTASRSRA